MYLAALRESHYPVEYLSIPTCPAGGSRSSQDNLGTSAGMSRVPRCSAHTSLLAPKETQNYNLILSFEYFCTLQKLDKSLILRLFR